MKNILYLFLILIFTSCKGQNHKEAKEILNDANDFFSKSKLNENEKLDSCIVMVNKAIKIDENYFRAYYIKSKFLTWKKDTKELIKNNAKMIELRPEQPMWKIQRGLFFDIDGNRIEAEKYYSIGISEYESLLKTELKNDFNFRMEYMSALETKGEIDKAKQELDKIDKDFPNNEILKVYKTEYKFKTKEELIQFWKNGGEN